MSSLAKWSYKATLTVWPLPSTDQYGQPTFGAPYTMKGSWEVGGDVQVDATGTEFVSMSKYYFEMPVGSALLPVREGFIKQGDYTATADPADARAERIRKVTGWGAEMFGATQIPDWLVVT